MKKLFTMRTLVLISLISVPALVFAQSTTDVSHGIKSFSTLVDDFTSTLVKSLATLFLSLGLLAFFYGIVKYVWGIRAGDANIVKTGNMFMRWGLVALFVMFSVYGIIKVGQDVLLGGKDVTQITIPSLNFKNSPSNNSSNGAIGSPGAQQQAGECSGKANGSSCGNSGSGSTCQNQVCVTSTQPAPTECSTKPDGASCGGGAGVCKGQYCVAPGANSTTNTNTTSGAQTPVTDCTGVADQTPCGAGGYGVCQGGTCNNY